MTAAYTKLLADHFGEGMFEVDVDEKGWVQVYLTANGSRKITASTDSRIPNQGIWSGYWFRCPIGTYRMDMGMKGTTAARLELDGTITTLTETGTVIGSGHKGTKQ